MTKTSEEVAAEFAAMLKDVGTRLQITVETETDAFRANAAAGLQALRDAVGQPGYMDLAAATARDSLAMALGRAVDVADAADNELWLAAMGGLGVAARFVAPA